MKEIQLALLIDIDMLKMVEKGVRGRKVDNKYMKSCFKIIESSYLMCWGSNNVYGCTLSQKLPKNFFSMGKNTSKFDESFTENY